MFICACGDQVCPDREQRRVNRYSLLQELFDHGHAAAPFGYPSPFRRGGGAGGLFTAHGAYEALAAVVLSGHQRPSNRDCSAYCSLQHLLSRWPVLLSTTPGFLFCGRLSDLSQPALSFRPAAVWGRVERKCKPSATAGYRSKKLPGYYDFIGVLTSRLAPLWCISCAATTREAIWSDGHTVMANRFALHSANRLSCSDSHESPRVARSASACHSRFALLVPCLTGISHAAPWSDVKGDTYQAHKPSCCQLLLPCLSFSTRLQLALSWLPILGEWVAAPGFVF